MVQTDLRSLGVIEQRIEYLDSGLVTVNQFKNNLLDTGRLAVTKLLAGEEPDQYRVAKMLFGDGGTSGGTPRIVAPTRTGLYGVARASKNVIANYQNEAGVRINFLSVLMRDDANGYTINEMALQLENGELYAMATFPGYAKTSNVQVTYTWVVHYL